MSVFAVCGFVANLADQLIEMGRRPMKATFYGALVRAG